MIAIGRGKKCKCYLYTQSCRLLKAAPVCSRAHWRLSIWWQVKLSRSLSCSHSLSGFFCAIGILMTKLASFLLDPKSHHNHHTTHNFDLRETTAIASCIFSLFCFLSVYSFSFWKFIARSTNLNMNATCCCCHNWTTAAAAAAAAESNDSVPRRWKI